MTRSITVSDDVDRFLHAVTGDHFPGSKEGSLWDLSQAAERTADALEQSLPLLSAAAHRITEGIGGYTREAFVGTIERYMRDPGYLPKAAVQLRSISGAQSQRATQLEYGKEQIIAGVVELMAEFLFAAAIAFLNPGWVLSWLAARIAAFRMLFQTIMRWLVTELVGSVAFETATDGLIDGIIQDDQIRRRHRSGFDLNSLNQALTGGTIAGLTEAMVMPFAHGLGHLVSERAMEQVDHVVETAAMFTGASTTEYVASGFMSEQQGQGWQVDGFTALSGLIGATSDMGGHMVGALLSPGGHGFTPPPATEHSGPAPTPPVPDPGPAPGPSPDPGRLDPAAVAAPQPSEFPPDRAPRPDPTSVNGPGPVPPGSSPTREPGQLPVQEDPVTRPPTPDRPMPTAAAAVPPTSETIASSPPSPPQAATVAPLGPPAPARLPPSTHDSATPPPGPSTATTQATAPPSPAGRAAQSTLDNVPPVPPGTPATVTTHTSAPPPIAAGLPPSTPDSAAVGPPPSPPTTAVQSINPTDLSVSTSDSTRLGPAMMTGPWPAVATEHVMAISAGTVDPGGAVRITGPELALTAGTAPTRIVVFADSSAATTEAASTLAGHGVITLRPATVDGVVGWQAQVQSLRTGRVETYLAQARDPLLQQVAQLRSRDISDLTAAVRLKVGAWAEVAGTTPGDVLSTLGDLRRQGHALQPNLERRADLIAATIAGRGTTPRLRGGTKPPTRPTFTLAEEDEDEESVLDDPAVPLSAAGAEGSRATGSGRLEPAEIALPPSLTPSQESLNDRLRHEILGDLVSPPARRTGPPRAEFAPADSDEESVSFEWPGLDLEEPSAAIPMQVFGRRPDAPHPGRSALTLDTERSDASGVRYASGEDTGTEDEAAGTRRRPGQPIQVSGATGNQLLEALVLTDPDGLRDLKGWSVRAQFDFETALHARQIGRARIGAGELRQATAELRRMLEGSRFGRPWDRLTEAQQLHRVIRLLGRPIRIVADAGSNRTSMGGPNEITLARRTVADQTIFEAMNVGEKPASAAERATSSTLDGTATGRGRTRRR